jgi:transposase
MGRGAGISDEERAKISVYLSLHKSYRFIAAQLNRSVKLVRSCVNRGIENKPGKSSGRKRKLSPAAVRRILRSASNQMTSARRIIAEQNLNVTPSTVRNVIHNAGYLQYEHIQSGSKIKPGLVIKRLSFHRELFASAVSQSFTQSHSNSVSYSRFLYKISLF